jgi:hypothetical protein
MNIWASLLRELPTLAQRQIARHQRISLPRGADAATRHTRLRHALCHAATVRAVYANLPRAAQDALQDLRVRRGGIAPAALIERYGPLRSWSQLALDPRPRSVSEQLVLLGWLLPRPAAPHHPPRLLLPPELRRWLPHPLDPPEIAPSTPELPPAQRVVVTLLLACAERPRALTRAGRLTHAELRQIQLRLAPLAAESSAALLEWLLPLLGDLGLVDTHASRATLNLAGQRFLGLTAAEQIAQLHAAWLRAPRPDPCLVRLRVDPRGIDWPLLRRRLCEWARAVPADISDPTERYSRLARSLGPLADAHTHGFRAVDRAPWQPRRAAAVLDAALRGPLAWLGLAPGGAIHLDREAADLQPAPMIAVPDRLLEGHNPSATNQTGDAWRYETPDLVQIPHQARQDITLRLLPFAEWHSANADAVSYRVTPATMARAIGQGHSLAACQQLLDQQAGPPPPNWCADLEASAPLRIVFRPVLLAEQPQLLERASRAREVRRHLSQRIAPGIALLDPQQIGPLTRALDRQGLPCAQEHAPAAPPPHGDSRLIDGERAALLLACAHYRQHAPPGASLLPHAGLEERLHAGLPPQLQAAVTNALAELRPPPIPAINPQPTPPSTTIARLNAALKRRGLIELTYDTGGEGELNRRTVRPLAIEQRDEHIYLRAYCTARQAERTFRVDRIVAVGGMT